ncbi:MECP2 isoform 7 [Pan troglodytes]|uniref:Methyl-CpG binding protein 2 n=3 Tax=Hominidae TaxID=9604 RepID=H7BY72_HUMAN|nr:MECP2 isoform 7 [Pan troglodytes]PNJ09464.1 MECP2 isoform 10 [Pongo abelii]
MVAGMLGLSCKMGFRSVLKPVVPGPRREKQLPGEVSS